jgi:hypothetical protein
MGAISDAMGDVRYGFVLAAGLAAILAIGFFANWLVKPAHARLSDDADHGHSILSADHS